jgi:2-polyprenyl-3-methyl-5-hydroxy-6-metoxy-1,4-benzoquinol methylase
MIATHSQLEPATAKPRPAHDEERPLIASCPICASRRLHYAFSQNDYRVVRCDDCGLMLLNPQPSPAELRAIYSETYFLGDDTPEARTRVARMKAATARLYLDQIRQYRGAQGGRLLEVGCGQGDFLLEAQRAGYDVVGVEISSSAARAASERLGGGKVICGEIESVALRDNHFDVCVLSDVIEHVRDPVAFLATIRRLLRPDGVLFVATPSLDSWSARLLRQNWMEMKPEHLTYFDTKTIQHAFYRTGFAQAIVQPGRKMLNLDYVTHHFLRYPVPVVTPLVELVHQLVPGALRRLNVPVVASGLMAIARAVPIPERRKLSVVVPAYNEAATFRTLMDALLRKTLPDLDMEIVVVESNSTDGTRDLALSYQHDPRVRVVLEDQPRGKGHAVRTGLAHATGDFVLIQDADLEYDLEDYDVLMEPLVQGREAFVLGSRHGGNTWKMRHFAEQQLLSTALNGGHWFFTTLVDVLFGLRLKDPFTMYKVFRRDCLYGLTFVCNRFDFDYELLIKLVRKGYTPVEIPVNYRSRSFREGKKVTIFRDPLTWLRAIAWLRVTRIDPMREVAQQRAAPAGQP